MTDPLGRILTEIRDAPAVAAITTRIRGGEPAPGDAKGPGEYLPFVVLVRTGSRREPRLPVQELSIAARCYGATYQQAAALAGAVGDAIHGLGPRISPSGIGIYLSLDEGSQGAEADPDTGQPVEIITFTVTAATQVVS